LTGILGACTLLSGTELSEKQAEYLRMSKVCGEQLLTIINDILGCIVYLSSIHIILADISKMEAGKMLLEANPFSLGEVVKESLEVVLFDANQKGLKLILEMDPALP